MFAANMITMNRIVLLLACIPFATVAPAQEIRVGGFLGYASDDIGQACLGITGEFMLNETMSIAPDVIQYFPETNENVKASWYEINANFNYYFLKEQKVQLYGQAGLNFTHFRASRNGNAFGTNGELGINIGFGLDFPVSDKVIPCLLMKYTIGDYDKALIGAGVKVRVN
jgi:outer membrane protein X